MSVLSVGAKTNVVQLVSACGWGCTSFVFAEALAFLFIIRLSFYWSVCLFTMTANGLRLGEGGDFTTELSYEAHTSNLR